MRGAIAPGLDAIQTREAYGGVATTSVRLSSSNSRIAAVPSCADFVMKSLADGDRRVATDGAGYTSSSIEDLGWLVVAYSKLNRLRGSLICVDSIR